jgi:RecA/RadA recombinase
VSRRKATVAQQDPIAAGIVPPPKRKPIPLPKGWKKAADALDEDTAVRTIFPDFNRATRIGGLPVRRISTIHGPTHGGKTAFAFGLIKSFVDGDHYAALVDAEHATGGKFASELISDLAGRDNFMAMRPSNYEETMDAVNEFLTAVKVAKSDRPELRSICVIDSINKLVPAKELEKVRASGAEELAKGHWGRVRAAMNQAWLDNLTPRLAAADCALVLIAQERDDNTDVWGKMDDWKIKGGRAIAFDASMLIRVSKSSPVFEPPGDKKQSNIVGFAHRVRVHKNKCGHMDGNYTDCVIHLSNGRFSPPGFDLARDAIHVAKQLGLVQVSGSWLTWQKRRWQGDTRAVQWLHGNAPQLYELLAEINAAVDQARSDTNAR